MRALLIDPLKRAVTKIEIGDHTCDISAKLGGRLRRAHRLPRGASLFVAECSQSSDRFKIGGSEPLIGQGIIVGSRSFSGHYNSTSVDEQAVSSIVCFIEDLHRSP